MYNLTGYEPTIGDIVKVYKDTCLWCGPNQKYMVTNIWIGKMILLGMETEGEICKLTPFPYEASCRFVCPNDLVKLKKSKLSDYDKDRKLKEEK